MVGSAVPTKKKPHEEPRPPGFSQEVHLVVGRKHRLEGKAPPVRQGSLAPNPCYFGRLQHGIGRIPVAKLVASNQVRIDVLAALEPCVSKPLLGHRGYSRPIGTRHNQQTGAFFHLQCHGFELAAKRS